MATLTRKSSVVETIGHLDTSCIIKEGYLVKSPPESDTILIKRRWRMRWFVLYDTQARTEIDPAVEREVDLIYYKSEDKVKQGLAKGKISLIGTAVYKHKGILHGYPHIINIQTHNRLYHLCTTKPDIHDEWLQQIREHHVPKAEILRQSLNERISMSVPSEEETRRPLSYPDDIITERAPRGTQKRYSTISTEGNVDGIIRVSSISTPSAISVDGVIRTCSISTVSSVSSVSAVSTDGSDDVHRHSSIASRSSLSSVDNDYTYNLGMPRMSCSSNESLSCSMPIKAIHLSRWINKEKTTYKKPCPLPPGEGPRDVRHDSSSSYVDMSGCNYKMESEGSSSSYVDMSGCYYKMESEDEGIGRTDSEASSISSISTSSYISSTNDAHAWQMERDALLSTLVSTRPQSTSSCRDAFLGGFVGPRLSTPTAGTKKGDKPLTRARSLGDLSMNGKATLHFEMQF